MKYFFFDIDGTLLLHDRKTNSSYVPESAKLAIQKLRENGHFCAIATGRAYATCYKVLDQLGFENMICDGGNGLVLNKKLVSIDPIDKKAVYELTKECDTYGFGWGITDEINNLRKVPDAKKWDGVLDNDYRMVEIKGLNPLSSKQIYKAFVNCKKGEEEKLTSLNKLDWVRFGDSFLFVEPCNKSYGIKKMVDILKGDYKDVVVFGDEKNDLSMFLDEWTSIAMGNAIPELKEKATYVTDTGQQDGIYKACQHFGFL